MKLHAEKGGGKLHLLTYTHGVKAEAPACRSAVMEEPPVVWSSGCCGLQQLVSDSSAQFPWSGSLTGFPVGMELAELSTWNNSELASSWASQSLDKA